MSLGRLLALAIVVFLGWWVVAKSGWFGSHETAAPDSRVPIARARDAARATDARNAAREGAQAEADAAPRGGAVTENMTPDQVRALLGSPAEIQAETTESGAQREKWLYPSAGKTVVFENGIVVSIQ
jgi:hypothetical protein